MIDDLTQNLALQEFFKQKVKEAINIQQASFSEDVEFYLVNILTHFSKSENLFSRNENGHIEYRALALKLCDSVFADNQREKFKHLKSLADTALYHAGVFYDGLYNQMVDVNYYINMGGSAYQSLANLSTGSHRSMADLFYELSQQFEKLVEILNVSCEKELVKSDKDILKLLDRYLKTGSKKAKELLEEQGILPDSLAMNKTVQ